MKNDEFDLPSFKSGQYSEDIQPARPQEINIGTDVDGSTERMCFLGFVSKELGETEAHTLNAAGTSMYMSDDENEIIGKEQGNVKNDLCARGLDKYTFLGDYMQRLKYLKPGETLSQVVYGTTHQNYEHAQLCEREYDIADQNWNNYEQCYNNSSLLYDVKRKHYNDGIDDDNHWDLWMKDDCSNNWSWDGTGSDYNPEYDKRKIRRVHWKDETHSQHDWMSDHDEGTAAWTCATSNSSMHGHSPSWYTPRFPPMCMTYDWNRVNNNVRTPNNYIDRTVLNSPPNQWCFVPSIGNTQPHAVADYYWHESDAFVMQDGYPQKLHGSSYHQGWWDPGNWGEGPKRKYEREYINYLHDNTHINDFTCDSLDGMIRLDLLENSSPNNSNKLNSISTCLAATTNSNSITTNHLESDNEMQSLDNALSNISPQTEISFINTVSKWEREVCSQEVSQMAQVYSASISNSKSKRRQTTHEFTMDSASTEHILSMEVAKMLLGSKRTQLKVIGVSGTKTRANVEGNLIITVSDGTRNFKIDLGTSYGMEGCPLNILSISKLIKQGAVLHFELGNCYMKLNKNSPSSIPLREKEGMFRINGQTAEESGASPTTSDFDIFTPSTAVGDAPRASTTEFVENGEGKDMVDDDSKSFSIEGKCFAAVSAEIKLWHRRVRHLNANRLLDIHKQGKVLGFKVKNPPKKRIQCDCESCKLAKIQRRPVPHATEYPGEANVIGHTVSVDTKSVGVTTHKGYKYVIAFVDKKSHLCMEYFMRSKSETTAMLKRYIKDMWRLGKVKIQNIQTDRGSEFFEQEGESQFNEGRCVHEFAKCCQDNGIYHIKLPVEEKEKLAEQWNKEHYRCADTMLLEARMHPLFWADAVAYSSYQYNRIPNELNENGESPWTMLTGEKVRWDTWKVFGCDVYEHIPNNKFNKIPGLPKGRKQIFLGFKPGFRGHLVFDPVSRQTHTAGNCYFDEDFSNRQNSLFFYDRRRAMQMKNEAQPDVVDDFDMSLHVLQARNVFSDSKTLAELQEFKDGKRETRPQVLEQESIQNESEDNDCMIRPVRLLRKGKAAKRTQADTLFLRAMEVTNSPCKFLIPSPKTSGSESGIRYERYMYATSLKQARELGATTKDINWDYDRGYIIFPNHESKNSAHVFTSQSKTSFGHGLHYKDRLNFNNVLETIYEPEVIEKMLDDKVELDKFTAHTTAKVLNSSSVEIDFSLDPEPVEYWQAIRSSESEDWKIAMKEEMASMVRFGVFNRVHRTVAKGRQILGCKWVYKRKIGKDGKVYRYRSRLVCQGFRQKAYDSFQPEETFSPVVHKDTLRLFLSASAAQNMTIYQADVKAAFLQAPLKEKIYMKCPPGFETYDENGGEEILELNSAVYGLKQSNACFWTAVHKHLVANGFVPTLGDPCLFKKIYDNNKTVYVCCYVDDLTYSAPDLETATSFLEMMRERFVIEKDEGKPIEWLLGMAINQDMEKGTVHMSMEMMITKLAHGILSPEELAKSHRVKTPMSTTPLLKQETRDVPQSEFDYLSVVGSLLHIANCVRCDISYAVGMLARHSMTVGHSHVKAAKRVVMYLYNTAKLGITYTRNVETINTPLLYEHAVHPLNNGKNLLQTFVDSDYAAHHTKRSTMGIVLMMNGGPITWSSVLGKTVATSTCEAEVNAAVSAVKESIHIKQLLVDMDLMDKDQVMQVAEDNAACIAQAEAGLRHVRNAKHYEVKLRFLQQHCVDKSIEFVYCPTDEQLADLFTKPLDDKKFVYFRDMIMKQPQEE